MIENAFIFCLIFLVSETLTTPIYIFVRRRFGHRHNNPIFNIESAKGFLERLVLLLGLVLNFPQILILFGALKIGNRLTSETRDDNAINYFLIGNLISVLFVFINYQAIEIIKELCGV